MESHMLTREDASKTAKMMAEAMRAQLLHSAALAQGSDSAESLIKKDLRAASRNGDYGSPSTWDWASDAPELEYDDDECPLETNAFASDSDREGWIDQVLEDVEELLFADAEFIAEMDAAVKSSADSADELS